MRRGKKIKSPGGILKVGGLAVLTWRGDNCETLTSTFSNFFNLLSGCTTARESIRVSTGTIYVLSIIYRNLESNWRVDKKKRERKRIWQNPENNFFLRNFWRLPRRNVQCTGGNWRLGLIITAKVLYARTPSITVLAAMRKQCSWPTVEEAIFTAGELGGSVDCDLRWQRTATEIVTSSSS